MSLFLLLTSLVACKTSGLAPYVEPEPTTTTPTGETPYVGGFVEGQLCDVQAVFQVSCVVGCHSGLVPEGGLDLQGDPYTTLVGVPSSINGSPLVTPGDPEGSLLYRKMAGTQGPDEGAIMPPSGLLDPFFLNPVQAWIEAGAPQDCNYEFEEETFTGTEPYHPEGWDDPGEHGLAANLQTDGDCRSCHGADLDGGTAGVSCDSCHGVGWRVDCTFCHGGVYDETGAPPEDIDNVADPNLISFKAHRAHVDGDTHPAYGCEQCHDKPSEVLTPDHIFDDVTAGYGEIDYTDGLPAYSTYLGGSCTNVYCHGTGLGDDGTIVDGEGPLACYDCHPDITSGDDYWKDMSGRHKQHLDNGDIYCSSCHSTVVDDDQYVIGPDYHVDGYPTVEPVSVYWDGNTCNGSCHGHDHVDNDW